MSSYFVVENYDSLSPKEAIALQNKLKSKVHLCSLAKKPKTILGLDISYNRYSKTHLGVGLVFSYPDFELLEKVFSIRDVHFPYIPGLLSFREVPLLVDVYRKLKTKVDLLFCDGQGMAHPRRLGLASHLGLVLNKASLGVAKKPLLGNYEEPKLEKGSLTQLQDKNEKIAYVLRSKTKTKPIFISPGHLINMKDSLTIVKEALTNYRIPLPTREAHLYANECRKKFITS